MSTYGLPPGGQAWYRRPGGKRAVRAWKVGKVEKPGAVHLFVRARWRWVPESWLCVPKSLTVKRKKT